MPDLLDSERELDKHHDKQFRHLDERFVTDRKKIKKPSPIKQVKSDSESSLTISTPSESCSSSSGSLDEVIKYNQRFLDLGDPEDMKPDQDMLEDYLTTMSMVLDESLSDEENDSRCKQLQPSESLHPVLDSSLALQEQNIKQNKHDSEVADKTLVTNTSSLYLTPNESFNEEPVSEKNHFSGFSLDKNLPVTSGTKPKERNLPTIAGTKPKGKDLVTAGTKPKGKDLVTAGTKPKGKDLVTAGTKPKGKDLVTAGTKPKGKDLVTAGTKPKGKDFVTAGTKPKGKDLVTAGTKPKDKNLVTAGTKPKGKDQVTEGIKPKAKSGNMKDSSRLKSVKLIQPSPAAKAKIGSKRLPEMMKSKVTATVESQQGSQTRKPASIISNTALPVKPAKEMFSGTESTLCSASESSQHHLSSLSTQSSHPHALLSASESSQQGTSTSTASSSRHIPKTVFKLPGQQTAISGANLRGASLTLSSTSIPRALPRPGVAKRVIANTLDQSSNSPLDLNTDPLEFGAVTKESANGKENVDRKTVIHVDHGTLWSDSSTDQQGSDSEFQKKKIPVDASIRSLSVPQIPHQPSIVSDIDDIPFADESEVDEKFFTPATSLKTKEVSSDSQVTDITSNARKKIFPPPCAVNLNPNLPSAQQIQFIQEAERNKAQEALKAKPQLNTENGKGVSFVNPSYNTVGVVPKRVPGTRTVPNDPRDRRSSSYDTPSSSSILSDNEDNSKQVTTSSTTHMTTTPMTSASEMDSTTKARKKKISKPLKSVGGDTKTKIHKHEDKSHNELEAKKEKRHSLLALLRPNKSAEKVRDKKDYSTSATPSESDYASDKKQKSKLKKKKKLSRSQENVEAGLSHDVKELKIAPIFEKDNDRRPSGAEGLLAESKLKVVQPLPMAPKAMLEDFSDSDESQISVSTLLRKKDGAPIDERVARKLERVAARQQKRAEQQRLRAAQEIQRRLQEVDERQQELENRGIAVEKALRGEGAEADVDESQLMGEWFNLVHEKNALVRYESELMVRAKELELEDRQSRLQQEFHDRSLKPESEKTAEEIEEDGQLLDELLDVVEQRNALVAMLEEDRLREQQEDRELENMMVKKGFVLAPLNYSRQPRSAPLDTSISRT